MNFTIVKPDGIVYQDEVEKLTIPTEAGEITILDNHAPMVSVLKAGELIIHKSGNIVNLSVAGGVIEIKPNNEISIMADSAERAEEIDIERAEEARKRAEELLKQQKDTESIDFARIQAMIDREMARISVGKKYRKLKR